MSDLAFDPTLKKKKKKGKKKIGFSELEASTTVDEATPVVEKVVEAAAEAEPKRIDEPEAAAADEAAPAEDQDQDGGDDGDADADDAGEGANDDDQEDDAKDGAAKEKKKKKSKKTKKAIEPLSKDAREALVHMLLIGDIPWKTIKKNKSEDGLGFDSTMKKKKKAKKSKSKKSGSTEKTEFTYDELLEQVFDIIKKNNSSSEEDGAPFTLVPPTVTRFGARRTGFTNFVQICQMLHRDREHVLSYLYAELGTSGSMDKDEALILKGRFQPRNIENVLKSYIKEYVRCHTCKSPNTLLIKQNRLSFLQCEKCKSKCSVAAIRTGYQMTGRRAALRAKMAG